VSGPIGNLTGGAVYQVRHLERLPLGTSYPAVVAHVGRLLAKLPARTELAIDLTGVGRPVFDLFVYAGIQPVGVLITAGTAETRHGPIIGVPKLLLVSRLQALLHEGRLKIHRDIPDAPMLIRELQDFRVEYTAAGSLTFNARSGRHDDLVLALAIAVWVAHGGWMASAGVYEYYRGLAGAGVPEREVVGVDLGQSRDPTAICVVRRVDIAAGIVPPEVEPVPPAEPAPAITYAEGSAQWRREHEEPQRPGFALVRHRDPSASLATGRPGAIPGTWVVPASAVDDLAAHGFRLVVYLAEAAEPDLATGQPTAA
jgi:hypothetical protein